jgi:hypothetical protein
MVAGLPDRRGTVTGLLLAPDAVTLYPPGTSADTHGWAEAGTVAGWTGAGNLQLSFGTTEQGADAGGGRGPHKPAVLPAGVLFLPGGMSPPPVNGAVAEVRGARYVLSDVHFMADPVAGAGVACWRASVTLEPGTGGGGAGG